MKIAVEGCAHGELEQIYAEIQKIEEEQNIKVDLLLCCGDFQATRNLADLSTMAVPKKYQEMGTFYKYYFGELKAPILTIFIGGNHEASNYLQELPYGGWVAPNIYYMGYAGVVKVNGVRIVGLSGIFKYHDFLKGRYEFSPYSEESKKSVYHVRQLEVFRLKQLSGTVDICMSHDWPRGVYNYGNKEQLIKFKPYFRDEIYRNILGSRPAEEILNLLKPKYWFAAHLHCQFAAEIPHSSPESEDSEDPDRPTKTKTTKFLALDKCLPRRRYLQILDIETPDSPPTEDLTSSEQQKKELTFEYDLEWLTILYITNNLTNVKNRNYYLPGKLQSNSDDAKTNKERTDFTPTEEEKTLVMKRFKGDLMIPKNFVRTVETFNSQAKSRELFVQQPLAQMNPISVEFCDKLGVDDPTALTMLMSGLELNYSKTVKQEEPVATTTQQNEEIKAADDVEHTDEDETTGSNAEEHIAEEDCP